MNNKLLSAPQLATLHRWKIVSLIVGLAAQIFLAGDWYGFAAIIPFITKSIDMTSTQIGLAQGVFSITYAIGMIVWGGVGRRLTARQLIVTGLAMTGLIVLLQSRVESYGALIGYRLAIGFFDSAVWIGTAKLIVGWFPASQRGRALGAMLAAFSLAITLDFAVGIPLSEWLGWRAFFALLGAGTLLVSLASLFLVRDVRLQLRMPDFSWGDNAASTHHAASQREVFRSKYFYIAAVAIFGAMFGVSATATWVVPAFIGIQHMPPSSAALIGTVMGLSQVAFLIVGGFLSDHYRKRIATMKVTALLSVIAAAALIGSAYFALSFGTLVVIAFLCGVVVASGGAIFALISEKCGDEVAGSAIGYAEMVGISSSFVAPALLGGILQITGSYAAAFGGFFVVEAVIFTVLMFCRAETHAMPATESAYPANARTY